MDIPADGKTIHSGLSALAAEERGGALTRRAVLAGAAAAATAGVAGRAAADEGQKADFLFVQTADGMAYAADDNRLTLRDVSPTTLFFSDRPERIAGNMSTESFVPFWSEGSDSFLSDPPNADLSIMVNGELRQVVVELRDPRLAEGNLIYTVKLIEGTMPVMAENASLFIDVIGMPLTPVSYAGVRRRAYRRAVLR
ncbi:hypothetical protein QO034_03425 [Sedimentitalea sp. JM2-8]|uniref:Uncharacterized protein n=1 Tax=Sedimentitalea xiamensis TaxID=3050037 RepID=A0ABT7FAM8_9RHOB|nr:hypothetical protein [Sedimentitalea xiamensis]MDK3072150.1 hypothetical protein [Sedimentitalea xiamensis]